MPDFTNADWEDYYGQDTDGFTHLSYKDRKGTRVFDALESNVEAQIEEVRRRFGSATELRLYKVV